MRFYSLLPVLASATVVCSMSVPPTLPQFLEGHFGAPSPPWNMGARPGWYFGDDNNKHPDLFCFTPLVCRILNARHYGITCPQRPPPVTYDGYVETFQNLTGATQAPDYMTFGLVDTVADCISMCNSVEGCNFVNTYHDVNGKDGSPLLTCSLYTSCHNATDATNTGGQSQPDGSIDYIIESDGWCKSS